MNYKVKINTRAQKEIENAIDFYHQYSENAPKNFIFVLKEAYDILEINPFFAVCYKNVRSLKLNKFPYSLYFVINEKKSTVRVLSCFHNKRNPYKRPLINQ